MKYVVVILILSCSLSTYAQSKKYLTKNVWKCTNVEVTDSTFLDRDTLIIEFAGVRTKKGIVSSDLFLCECLDVMFSKKGKEFGYFYINPKSTKVLQNTKFDLKWEVDKKESALTIYNDSGYSRKYKVIIDNDGQRMTWIRID